MATRAEAKYRVSAEDQSGQAFQSFKRNVTTANETVEKLRSSVRLAALALGAGGLVRSFAETIRSGARVDATLAGAHASLTRMAASGDELKMAMARGVAPALAAVSDELADLMGSLERSADRGPSLWDQVLGGFAAGLAGKPGMGAAFTEFLNAKREQLRLEGEARLSAEAEEENFKRAFALRESLRGAQEKYNDSLGEYNWLLRQGLLTQQEVDALAAKRYKELLALPAVTIPRDNAFLMEIADEFEMYSDEWHDQLVGALTPSTEDWPAAKGKWDLFFGGIKAAATEASEGMERAFTDALFDMERAGDHLLAYLTQVFKAISDAMLAQYVTGPLLQAIGLGGGGASTVYGSPIGPTPGGEPLGPNKALPGGAAAGGATVIINCVESRTGLEFLAKHRRDIFGLVQLESERRYLGGAK